MEPNNLSLDPVFPVYLKIVLVQICAGHPICSNRDVPIEDQRLQSTPELELNLVVSI